MAGRKDNHTVFVIVIAVLGILLATVMPGIIIFGIYAVLGGGIVGGVYFFKPGDLHVVCPDDRYVGVIVDGEQETELDPGEVDRLTLPRGDHVVRFVDRETGRYIEYDIDVGGGFYSRIAPVTPDQCFVSFDVSEIISPGVQLADEEPARPWVHQRWDEREPFDRPGSTYLDENMLPTYLEGGCCAYLMLSVPCSELDLPDDELVDRYFL